MTNNNFEKRIQEKLNQFEIEPSENLLENIFEKRAARSKGVFHLPYLKLGIAMLAIVAVSAVVVSYWPSSKENTGVSEINNATALPENTDDGATHSNKNKFESNSLAESNKDQILSEKNADIQNDNKKNDRNQLLSANQSNHNKKLSIQKNNERFVESGSVLVSHANNNHKTHSGNNIQSKDEFNDNGDNIEARYFDLNAGNKPKIASIEHKGNSHLMVYQSVSPEKLANLDLNYLFIEPIHTYPSDKSTGEQIALIDYKASDRIVTSKKPIFVDLMFTPFMTIHHADGNNSLKENYGVMSKTVLNKQYNLRVSYPVSRNVNVFAGLGYTNLYTYFRGDFAHSKNAVRYETITNYINDPILGPIAVSHIDTINYVDNSPLKYDFRNTYQILNLPVGLSYNFGVKDFDFGIHGSAIFNVYASSKGSNADFVNSQTESFNSNKKHLGVGGGISFMVAYKLTNKIKFIAEPGLQFYNINSQKNGNVINEKVLNSGLSFGLRYTLL